MMGQFPERMMAVARNYRGGLPGRAVLASTVTLLAVAAGLAGGGRPVQAAVRHHPYAPAQDTISSAGELTAVSAVSPTDVWVAGLHDSGGRVAEPLVLHWNGKTWATVSTPFLSRQVEFPVSLSAVSPADVWAAVSSPPPSGDLLIVRWNGKTWTQVRLPANCTGDECVRSVSADSATDAWTVGFAGPVNGSLMILHCNGTTCQHVKSPVQARIKELFGVSADSPTDAWAVGGYGSTSLDKVLILHWDGKTWTQVTLTGS